MTSLKKCSQSACETYDVLDEVFPICLLRHKTSLTKCFLSACETYDVLDKVFPICLWDVIYYDDLDEVFPIFLWDIWRPWRSVSYLPVTHMTLLTKCLPSAWQVFPGSLWDVKRRPDGILTVHANWKNRVEDNENTCLAEHLCEIGVIIVISISLALSDVQLTNSTVRT